MQKQKEYLSDQDKIRKTTLYIKAKFMNHLRKHVNVVKGGIYRYYDDYDTASAGDNFKWNFEYNLIPEMYKEIEAYKKKIYQRRKAINGSGFTPPKKASDKVY